MAGDVYTQPPYVGRGGWSWYTGSAAWMHRAAVESICGLRWRTAAPACGLACRATGPKCACNCATPGPSTCSSSVPRVPTRPSQSALAAGALPLAVGEWLILADGASADARAKVHLVVQAAVPRGEAVPKVDATVAVGDVSRHVRRPRCLLGNEQTDAQAV